MRRLTLVRRCEGPGVAHVTKHRQRAGGALDVNAVEVGLNLRDAAAAGQRLHEGHQAAGDDAVTQADHDERAVWAPEAACADAQMLETGSDRLVYRRQQVACWYCSFITCAAYIA